MSKEVVTQVRMSKHMKEACRKKADRLGLTLSAWVRMKILKALKEEDND